jgi:hypothetical protein
MHQRHEHLLSPLTPAGHIILHNRDAACEAVFVPKPFEDPFRRRKNLSALLSMAGLALGIYFVHKSFELLL